jgi:hypothetical protein
MGGDRVCLHASITINRVLDTSSLIKIVQWTLVSAACINSIKKHFKKPRLGSRILALEGFSRLGTASFIF